jgi:hypothetical protein
MRRCAVSVVCAVALAGLPLLSQAATPQEFGKWKKGENLVVAGDFEDLIFGAARMDTKQGAQGWTLEDGTCCNRGAEYKWELDKKEFHGGKQSLKVIGVKASGTDWHAKVRHDSTSMKGGKNYTAAFWAKAEKSRAVSLSVQLQHDPWTFFQGGNFDLTQEWAEYSKTFGAPQDIDRDMWVGLAIAQSDVSFWLDDFRFWEGEFKDEIKAEPTPQAVEAGGKLAVQWADIRRSR